MDTTTLKKSIPWEEEEEEEEEAVEAKTRTLY